MNRTSFEVYTALNSMDGGHTPRWVCFSVPEDWLHRWLESMPQGTAESYAELILGDAITDGVVDWEEVDA